MTKNSGAPTLPLLAIITGRSVEDISSHISFKPRYIIGNHGIEGIHTEEELLTIKEIIQFYRSLIQNQFQDKLEELGILLEDKVYSLSLHYRNSKTPNEAEFFIQTHMNCFASVKLSPGKMVFNLTPNIGINKGQAFISLLKKENAKFGFYIGDDETDEDVFVYRDPRLLTVRIGFSEKSKAKYYIKSQAEICQVLETLCKIY